MKVKLLSCVLIGLVLTFALGLDASSQTRRGRKPQRGAVCFDPTAPCKTTATFEAYDMPFRVPANAVIWESELFYAIILTSVRFDKDEECDQKFVPEEQRLEAQALFPNRKVFASRCADAGSISYSGTSQKANFMAVYGGRTQAEAARMLDTVKATGKFPGANIRRMNAFFNGT